MSMISNLQSTFENLFKQKALLDGVTAFGVRILSALLAYAVQIFLARALNLADYGIYVTLWTWLIVVNHIATFGFSESALRFIPRYTHQQRHHWARGFLLTGYKVVILGSISVSIILLGGLYAYGESVSASYLIPITIIALGLPLTALEIYLEGVSRGFGWFLLTMVPTYILRPIAIALGVLLALHLGFEPDAALVLSIAVLTTALSVLVQVYVIKTRIAAKEDVSRPAPKNRFWIKASLPLCLILGFDEIFAWSDILFVSLLVAPEEVSVYFAAQRSMALAAFVQFAFMFVVAREFSLAKASRNKTALQEQVTKSTFWTFWMTLPAVVITLAIGYPLLWLFGQEFLKGYPVMLVLGLGYVIKSTVGQAFELLVILGRQKTNLVISIASVLINLVLCYALIPAYGILGAAYAITFSYAVRSFLFAVAIRKLERLNVFVRFYQPQSSPH